MVHKRRFSLRTLAARRVRNGRFRDLIVAHLPSDAVQRLLQEESPDIAQVSLIRAQWLFRPPVRPPVMAIGVAPVLHRRKMEILLQ